MPHDMSAQADSCQSWIRQPRKATTPQTTFSSKCQSNAGPWIGGLPSWPRIIGGGKKWRRRGGPPASRCLSLTLG